MVKPEAKVIYRCEKCGLVYDLFEKALECENRKPMKICLDLDKHGGVSTTRWDIGSLCVVHNRYEEYNLAKITDTELDVHRILPILYTLDNREISLDNEYCDRIILLSDTGLVELTKWLTELNARAVGIKL